MSADRDVTHIVRSWLEEGATALPDRVLDTVLDQLPATPQRRSWWPTRRVPHKISPTTKLAIAAAAVAVVAVVGMNLLPRQGVIGGPGPSPTPTLSVSPSGSSIAEEFQWPFEYTHPPGSELILTTVSLAMYAFTEGSTETYPGFGYQGVRQVRGLTVTFGTGPRTHGGGARDTLPLRTEAFLTDLRGNPTLTVGPITPTVLGGLPALQADVENTGGNIYPDIHMAEDALVALAFPSRLIVAEVEGGSLLVHIWAATDEELAVWRRSPQSSLTRSVSFNGHRHHRARRPRRPVLREARRPPILRWR